MKVGQRKLKIHKLQPTVWTMGVRFGEALRPGPYSVGGSCSNRAAARVVPVGGVSVGDPRGGHRLAEGNNQAYQRRQEGFQIALEEQRSREGCEQ